MYDSCLRVCPLTCTCAMGACLSQVSMRYWGMRSSWRQQVGGHPAPVISQQIVLSDTATQANSVCTYGELAAARSSSGEVGRVRAALQDYVAKDSDRSAATQNINRIIGNFVLRVLYVTSTLGRAIIA